ncbi:hypothetical protein H9Y04_04970 [Streptomyces sp. TRM66268-LWL]|uniref:Tetratricopeptide repeat protein n=1 Tax=Streptomyces polyasparticus TaxID=2767826 RepID=A0ABR7S8X1_9ACTN|nr:hypothetical protein [Streptomyces polyasparticus]MBC9711922.1 hypothetical protein [Streptomyces polyasparticus]
MTDALHEARKLLDEGDIPATVRQLRSAVDTAELREIAGVVRKLSEAVGFDDLAAAATKLTERPGQAQALFDFGYGCVERGISFLAVPALREALRLDPDTPIVLNVLVSALENEYRHAEAARLLAERDATLLPWPQRYLLAHNALLAGDLAQARAQLDRLPEPQDPHWLWPLGRLRRMTERAAAAAPRDLKDLRGWQFAVHGGYLLTRSPWGYEAGMTGRWAYTQDSYDRILHGLRRLGAVLGTAGAAPASVSLLPDRSSRILGTAAARHFGLPVVEFDPARTDTLVVAYDLNDGDQEQLSALGERTPGQILFEHATSWTDPPVVPADVSTLLAQVNIAPWARTLRVVEGETEQVPADERPVDELAAEILAAGPYEDEGDGEAPADPEEALTSFVAATAGAWRNGTRDRVDSPGPVPGSRFL